MKVLTSIRGENMNWEWWAKSTRGAVAHMVRPYDPNRNSSVVTFCGRHLCDLVAIDTEQSTQMRVCSSCYVSSYREAERF